MLVIKKAISHPTHGMGTGWFSYKKKHPNQKASSALAKSHTHARFCPLSRGHSICHIHKFGSHHRFKSFKPFPVAPHKHTHTRLFRSVLPFQWGLGFFDYFDHHHHHHRQGVTSLWLFSIMCSIFSPPSPVKRATRLKLSVDLRRKWGGLGAL